MALILKGEEEGGSGSSRLGSDFLVGKQVRQLVRGVRSAVQGPTGGEDGGRVLDWWIAAWCDGRVVLSWAGGGGGDCAAAADRYFGYNQQYRQDIFR